MSEQRKLTTIMAVDVAGYSQAAETDESAAADAVRHLRKTIEAMVAPLGGRVFNTAGDGFMIELPTASAGVEAATQLLAAPDAPKLRIGLHLGEVIVSDNGDLLGHGVNVAARLQQMAEPGSALVSNAVQAQIHSGRVKFAPLGRVQLDKMHDRIEVFALSGAGGAKSFRRVFWRRARRALIALLVIGVLGVGGYVAWRMYGPQQTAETPRLAVLRFETLGETEPYFTETLADELIAYASRMEGLDVIGRVSSFSLEGPRATPQVAAEELNATLVLTGSVRRVGDQVNVRAQLAEAQSGRQIWSEEFDRPLSEIYTLQHQIAARVAIAAGLRANAPPSRRVNPQAYEFYVRGREALVSPGDPQIAATLLEQAVALDPEFAAAWAYLAQSRSLVAQARWANATGLAYDPSWFEPVLAAADRAMAIDPSSPMPHEIRSRAFRELGQWAESLEATERAAERGGGSSGIYVYLGYTQRARVIAGAGVERNPLDASAWFSLTLICVYSADLPCALEGGERLERLIPGMPPYYRALALGIAGRSAEALALTRQDELRWRNWFDPNVAPLDMHLVRAMLREGEAPSSEQLLATLQHGGFVENLIDVFLALDRVEDAALLLPHWTAASRPSLGALYHPRLAPMRARQEFWDLMEREGIAQHWRTSGDWPDFCERERAVCEAHLR